MAVVWLATAQTSDKNVRSRWDRTIKISSGSGKGRENYQWEYGMR